MHGDRLHWRGPAPPTDLLDDLRKHKVDVLSLLATEAPLRVVNAQAATAVAAGSDTRNARRLTELERKIALARLGSN